MRAVLACLCLVLAAQIAFAPPARAADDEKALIRDGRAATKVCLACHHFRRAKRKFGPDLVDIVGRPVASARNYPYSDALKRMGGVWSEDRLIEFLIDPDAYAPGNVMKFDGLKDRDKARAAVAYIAARYGG